VLRDLTYWHWQLLFGETTPLFVITITLKQLELFLTIPGVSSRPSPPPRGAKRRILDNISIRSVLPFLFLSPLLPFSPSRLLSSIKHILPFSLCLQPSVLVLPLGIRARVKELSRGESSVCSGLLTADTKMTFRYALCCFPVFSLALLAIFISAPFTPLFCPHFEQVPLSSHFLARTDVLRDVGLCPGRRRYSSGTDERKTVRKSVGPCLQHSLLQFPASSFVVTPFFKKTQYTWKNSSHSHACCWKTGGLLTFRIPFLSSSLPDSTTILPLSRIHFLAPSLLGWKQRGDKNQKQRNKPLSLLEWKQRGDKNRKQRSKSLKEKNHPTRSVFHDRSALKKSLPTPTPRPCHPQHILHLDRPMHLHTCILIARSSLSIRSLLSCRPPQQQSPHLPPSSLPRRRSAGIRKGLRESQGLDNARKTLIFVLPPSPRNLRWEDHSGKLRY